MMKIDKQSYELTVPAVFFIFNVLESMIQRVFLDFRSDISVKTADENQITVLPSAFLPLI